MPLEVSAVAISRAAKKKLFVKQKGRCNYCGRTGEIGRLRVDHTTPVARGGGDNPSNLQLLCLQCSTRKGDMTDGEFRRSYHLTQSEQSKGPPTKAIPQSHFDHIQKQRKAKERRQLGDSWLSTV